MRTPNPFIQMLSLWLEERLKYTIDLFQSHVADVNFDISISNPEANVVLPVVHVLVHITHACKLPLSCTA